MDLRLPFWSRVEYSQLPENLTLATLARASHSAVLWRGSVIIYSGYQFPEDGYSSFRPFEQDTVETFDINDDDDTDTTDVQVLHYLIGSESWDLLMTSGGKSNMSSNESIPLVPSPRYGHTAVVYNVSSTHTVSYTHLTLPTIYSV